MVYHAAGNFRNRSAGKIHAAARVIGRIHKIGRILKILLIRHQRVIDLSERFLHRIRIRIAAVYGMFRKERILRVELKAPSGKLGDAAIHKKSPVEDRRAFFIRIILNLEALDRLVLYLQAEHALILSFKCPKKMQRRFQKSRQLRIGIFRPKRHGFLLPVLEIPHRIPKNQRDLLLCPVIICNHQIPHRVPNEPRVCRIGSSPCRTAVIYGVIAAHDI